MKKYTYAIFNPYANYVGGGNVVQEELFEILSKCLRNTDIIQFSSKYDLIVYLFKAFLRNRNVLLIEQGIYSPIYVILDFIRFFIKFELIIIPRGDYVPSGLENWSVPNKYIKCFFWNVFVKRRFLIANSIVFTSDLEKLRFEIVGLPKNIRSLIIPDSFNGDSRFMMKDYLNQDNPFLFEYFLYVGRISVEKNTIFLIECYKSFYNDRSQTELPRLVLFTPTYDGPYYDLVKRKVEAYGLNNLVIFISSLNYDLRDIYSNCLVNLLPSHIESFGLTVLEALLFGKKTIVSENCFWYTSEKEYVIPGKLSIENWVDLFFRYSEPSERIFNINYELNLYDKDILINSWRKVFYKSDE